MVLASLSTVERAAADAVVSRRPGWSKGLTALTDPRVARMARARTGQGSWSKGLTAASDVRIARNAANRRGRRRGPYKKARDGSLIARCSVVPVPSEREAAYAYVLGMYLGDGYVAKFPRTYRLCIFLDLRYPDLADRCAKAVRIVNPHHPVHVGRRGKRNDLMVSVYGRCWLDLLPQHGPGRKHERPIRLTDWQTAIIRRQALAFLNGLLDSDGSRFVRKVGGRAYPAYGFSNRSADILSLFCWACDVLGLSYTRPTKFAVSIARRKAVERLDRSLPPKS